ncbi:acyl-CoA synthetase [Enemella sp. A6]|uniref:acyl-CoA synthetase n=1 Tax=Enemella sp. A6 TaxID=3440152 RepID=UPI003EBEF33D
MTCNLADLIEHAVDAVPQRPALLSDRGNRTFAELEQRANRLAHALAARGVGPGDKVGVLSRNTVEAIEAMVAAYKLRAMMVNINFRYVAGEVEYLVNNSDMVTMVCERRYLPVVAEAFDRCPKLTSVLVVETDPADGTDQPEWAEAYEDALVDQSPERDFGERSPDDIFLLYTGGTTGHPKGVMWRQEDAWRVFGGGIDLLSGEYLADEFQQSRAGAAGDQVVRFPVPPLIHGAAQWATLSSLFNCGAAVLLADFDAHAVWQRVEQHRVNVMMITGDAMARPLLEALAEGKPDGGEYDLSSLRVVSSTAVLFSATMQQQFVEKLPHCFISDSMGASEAGFNGMNVIRAGHTTTQMSIRLDTSTAVLDENGRPVEPGSGEVGMLARKGHIALGYYNDEKKTRETFREYDGVRYAIPGDLARVEADGSVTVLGRGSTSINSGGEKIFPDEVEAAVRAHPDVQDALVLGVPDDHWGHRVAAIVVRTPGSQVGLADLNRVARQHIAGYKVPRSVWFVDEIKRSPAGKSDLRWARQLTTEKPSSEDLPAT